MYLPRFAIQFGCVVLLVAITVATPRPLQAGTCPQASIALKAGNALITAAKAGSAAQFSRALRTYADMRRIAFFGLGRHRKSLPRSKRGEFTRAVTIMISRTFNNYRRKFRAESIDFVDCRGSKVHTKMYFLGGKGYQPVIWRFRGNRIVDVNIQSLWLGQLLRDQINGQIKKYDGDIDTVIRDMKRSSIAHHLD